MNDLEERFANTPFTKETVAQAQAKIGNVGTGELTDSAKEKLRELWKALKTELERDRVTVPPDCLETVPGMAKALNSDTESSLTVVQAADPDALRIFASNLGNAVYTERRRSGQNVPLVSFLFDEADEFIPQDYANESFRRSAGIAKALARRGRKFGLGIGIATQRITYLDTNIMAQPHTYFISKLPRKSDRERVCEAFGISEEMFRQTFKFRKGNWLLVSHDATGLESVPLPVHADNADQRILDWLKSLSGAEGL